MRKVMIAAGIVMLATAAQAAGPTSTTANNVLTKQIKANAAIYKRALAAETKQERGQLTDVMSWERQRLEMELAETNNPVVKAQIRLQLATAAAGIKQERVNLTNDVKLARAQAIIDTANNGGAVPPVMNVMSTYLAPSGTMIVTVRDSEGGISIIQVN